MRMLVFFPCLLGLVPQLAVAADQPGLVGNWKLISYQLIIDGAEPQLVLGEHPKGYLILTPQGRMMGVLTSDTRKFGPSDAERAELLNSMVAYSGKYRVEGSDFVTTVDVSWNEVGNGTEQRRHYKLDKDRLTINTVPQPSAIYGGKTVSAELAWERGK